jgi:C1A family cysteine protease
MATQKPKRASKSAAKPAQGDGQIEDWSHVRGTGWRPQAPDIRDRPYAARLAAAPPAQYDLRPQMPPVYDQLRLESCTSNAVAAAMEYERDRQGLSDFMPSRLFIWYIARAMEGHVSSNDGVYIRTAIKVVNREGACPETMWPYEPWMFAVTPPKRCYVTAIADRLVKYEAPHTLGDLKDAISSNIAVAFGFTLYQSIYAQPVYETGVIPMPQPDERPVGGHAVLAVGYSDSDSHVIVRNSWSANWGDHGYGYMPYQYLTGTPTSSDDSRIDLYQTSDFWALELVSSS